MDADSIARNWGASGKERSSKQICITALAMFCFRKSFIRIPRFVDDPAFSERRHHTLILVAAEARRFAQESFEEAQTPWNGACGEDQPGTKFHIHYKGPRPDHTGIPL